MPVELEALMTDMKDIDEAEKLGLPKTKAEYESFLALSAPFCFLRLGGKSKL